MPIGGNPGGGQLNPNPQWPFWVGPLPPSAVPAAPSVDTPPPPVVVPLFEERRRQEPPLPAIVVTAAYQTVAPTTAVPPAPTVVPFEPLDEETVDATSSRGFADPGPGPVGTTPPRPTVVDRVDQRVRYKPLDPIALSGALQSVSPPTVVTPPPPTVSIPTDRRRIPEPPVTTHGADDAAAPQPTVSTAPDRRRLVEPPLASHGAIDNTTPTVSPPEPTFTISADRRRPAEDPIVVRGAIDNTGAAPVTPPEPTVVPLEQTVSGQSSASSQRGFVDPGPGPVGTTPPAPFFMPPDTRRPQTLQPIVLTGVYATPTVPVIAPPPPTVSFRDLPRRPAPDPFFYNVLAAAITPPPPPPTILAGTDWAVMSTW